MPVTWATHDFWKLAHGQPNMTYFHMPHFLGVHQIGHILEISPAPITWECHMSQDLQCWPPSPFNFLNMPVWSWATSETSMCTMIYCVNPWSHDLHAPNSLMTFFLCLFWFHPLRVAWSVTWPVLFAVPTNISKIWFLAPFWWLFSLPEATPTTWVPPKLFPVWYGCLPPTLPEDLLNHDGMNPLCHMTCM